MISSGLIGFMLVCSLDEGETDLKFLVKRISSVERSIERFEIAGERRAGAFEIQLAGDEDATMNWSVLSSVVPEYDAPHAFVVERDFTNGILYYSSGAKTDAWQEYHASPARSILFHHNLEDVFPTTMLSAGLYDECRDDASPPRWDLLWLKPIRGAALSEAILQTQDEATTASWTDEERFRVNNVQGEAGKRIVDVSLVYLHKTLDRGGRVSLNAYRLLLAEDHDFMPLVICPISPRFVDNQRGRMIDGVATGVIMYEDYRNVDGVPIPHVTNAYTVPFRGRVTTVRTELKTVKINEKAMVRGDVEIPVGSWVIDSIQGKSYRQGDQERVIDEAADRALKQVDHFEEKILEENGQDGNAARPGNRSSQPGGTFGAAIACGILVGLFALGLVCSFRK